MFQQVQRRIQRPDIYVGPKMNLQIDAKLVVFFFWGVGGVGRKSSVPSLDKIHLRASLVAQWLRVCLPMQGTRVRALAREDPTCRGATKPVRHNY